MQENNAIKISLNVGFKIFFNCKRGLLSKTFGSAAMKRNEEAKM